MPRASSRPPFAPGQVWEWRLWPGEPHERRFRWDILEVGIKVRPDPVLHAMRQMVSSFGVRGLSRRQRSYDDGVKYQRGDGSIAVDSARWLRRRALNAKCVGTAEDGSSSAREASAVPQDQGATPSSAPLAHEETK